MDGGSFNAEHLGHLGRGVRDLLGDSLQVHLIRISHKCQFVRLNAFGQNSP